DQTQTSGDVRRALFEHVAAQRIVRVAQPRSFASDRGNPKGGKPGAPSLGYFSWQDKKSDLPPGNPRQSARYANLHD
ncbi:MAG: hypothetical protein WA056_12695, partial [Gallionella sp.]